MNWQQLVMELDTLDADAVEMVFERHGAQSITLTDAGDRPVLEPAPGETPLWTHARITGLFAADADIDALIGDIETTFRIERCPPHRVETLADRAWEREWLKDFGPMQFGERLWVLPGDATAPDDAVTVRLDPGLAFGTGTHPTTALCLEWLDGLELAGRSVLDYGCGSGILAIAALKLGAGSAVAMDIDPQAVAATRDNAVNNDVAERLDVVGSDAAINGRFDVVVANILAGPLVELADCVTARLASAGDLALSGILSEQVGDIVSAYSERVDLAPPSYREAGGQSWVRLSGKRSDS
ncbi:MAG: 50S ribosomal protein L11 methyltransferase [Pseudomonadota bacterium]